MKTIKFTAFAAVLLLSNCYMDPNSHASADTANGAAIGGIIGAIIGHQSGETANGALLGAAAGGLIGNNVGLQKDRAYGTPNNYGGYPRNNYNQSNYGGYNAYQQPRYNNYGGSSYGY